jgi:hypothetical protein
MTAVLDVIGVQVLPMSVNPSGQHRKLLGLAQEALCALADVREN